MTPLPGGAASATTGRGRHPAGAATRLALAVAALLGLHAGASLWSASRESPVYDEVAHIGAGYAHLVLHDHRFVPVAAPLMKLLAVSLVAPHVPPSPSPEGVAAVNGWRLGYDLLYRHGDGRALLWRARLPFVGLSLLLGLALFGWGRELWGNAGGLAALFLHASSSEMLAHSHYATLDLGMALFTTLGLWGGWRFVRRPSLLHGLWVASAFALALVTKYSAPALVIMGGALVLCEVVRILRDDRRRGLELAVRSLLLAEGALVISLLAIWAGFGFRAAIAPGVTRSGISALEALLPVGSGLRAVLEALLARGVIPEGFADGIAATAFVPHNHQMAFLGGDIADGGWWYYFPVAIALKTPLPLLALVALAVLVRRPRGEEGRALLSLGLAAAAYLGIAMLFRISVGYRHLLPMMPILFLVAARGLVVLAARRRLRWLEVLLLIWLAGGTVRVAPHFLSFFNELAGGPEGGSRWLVDSNCDWGQDLDELGRLLRRERLPAVKLSYFGNGSPDAAGIHYLALPGVNCCWRPPGYADRLESGDLVAVSVTNLRGVYFRLPGTAPMPLKVRLDGEPEVTLPFADALRLLDERYAPIARAGYSIRVYRLLPEHRRIAGKARPG